jgi:hypothetical protein
MELEAHQIVSFKEILYLSQKAGDLLNILLHLSLG